MLSRKYKIDLKAINQNTESTSAISKASYEVENANNNGLSKRDVINQFNDLKKMKNSLLILNMLIVTLILLLE